MILRWLKGRLGGEIPAIDQIGGATETEETKIQKINTRFLSWQANNPDDRSRHQIDLRSLSSMIESILEKSYATEADLRRDLELINKFVLNKSEEELTNLVKSNFIIKSTPEKVTEINVNGKIINISVNVTVFPNGKNRQLFNLILGDYTNAKGARWERTRDVQERLIEKRQFLPPDKFSPNGYFVDNGRPVRIIGRDTEIDKGAYLGGSKRAGIEVDQDKDDVLKKFIQKVYSEINSILQRSPDGIETKKLLEIIFHIVKTSLDSKNEAVEYLESEYGTDSLILLGKYIENGVGVCRQQAILAAFIIESLIKLRRSTGHVSVDRNERDMSRSHAWVRYTSERGQIYIIDPAYNYCGEIENVKNMTPNAWPYKRPGE